MKLVLALTAGLFALIGVQSSPASAAAAQAIAQKPAYGQAHVLVQKAGWGRRWHHRRWWRPRYRWRYYGWAPPYYGYYYRPYRYWGWRPYYRHRWYHRHW